MFLAHGGRTIDGYAYADWDYNKPIIQPWRIFPDPAAVVELLEYTDRKDKEKRRQRWGRQKQLEDATTVAAAAEAGGTDLPSEQMNRQRNLSEFSPKL